MPKPADHPNFAEAGPLGQWLRTAQARLDQACTAASWLLLPLAFLLFAQWPLRDGLGAGSRQANDAAQCIFAITMAFAVRWATRRGAHLAAPTPSLISPAAAARWARWGGFFAVLPVALFALVVQTRPMLRSVMQLEGFPDTYNPGYFLVQVSAWVLAALVALQALLDLLISPPPR